MAARLKVVEGRKPMSVKLSAEERQELRRVAYLSDKSMGAFIREAALAAAKRVTAKAA